MLLMQPRSQAERATALGPARQAVTPRRARPALHLAVDAGGAHGAVGAARAPAQRDGAPEARADGQPAVGGGELPAVHAVAGKDEVRAHGRHGCRREVAHVQLVPARPVPFRHALGDRLAGAVVASL